MVTLASTIVREALSNPCLTANRNLAPFTNSSRMRSKISTFASTLMPTVNTKPARPGRVNGAEIKMISAKVNRTFNSNTKQATRPEKR